MKKRTDEELEKIRKVVGDIDSTKLTAILALEPSVSDVEEAVLKIQGFAGPGGHDDWPLTGKAGAVFDILAADLEDDSRKR